MANQFRKFFKDKRYLEIEALVLLIGIFFIILWIAGPLKSKRILMRKDTGGENITSAFDANDAALRAAQEWREDAVLSTLTSNTAKNGEMIDSWRFIFISASAPRKGFVVDVAANKVMGSEEINYVGTGAEFSDAQGGLISQGEAIRRIHTIPGYENETIIGIETVYDTVKHTWFWAARTSRGVVSIEAKP